MLTRWKYRFLCWFFDRPDSMARRVKVENALMAYATKGTSPTPNECREMAQTLGVPQWMTYGQAPDGTGSRGQWKFFQRLERARKTTPNYK